MKTGVYFEKDTAANERKLTCRPGPGTSTAVPGAPECSPLWKHLWDGHAVQWQLYTALFLPNTKLTLSNVLSEANEAKKVNVRKREVEILSFSFHVKKENWT